MQLLGKETAQLWKLVPYELLGNDLSALSHLLPLQDRDYYYPIKQIRKLSLDSSFSVMELRNVLRETLALFMPYLFVSQE